MTLCQRLGSYLEGLKGKCSAWVCLSQLLVRQWLFPKPPATYYIPHTTYYVLPQYVLHTTYWMADSLCQLKYIVHIVLTLFIIQELLYVHILNLEQISIVLVYITISTSVLCGFESTQYVFRLCQPSPLLPCKSGEPGAGGGLVGG